MPLRVSLVLLQCLQFFIIFYKLRLKNLSLNNLNLNLKSYTYLFLSTSSGDICELFGLFDGVDNFFINNLATSV